MALELIILISLVIVLAGTLPWWRYSRGWGYGAPGFIGAVLVILLMMAVTGRVPA